MNSTSRYSLGFFGLDSGISRGEAVRFGVKTTKIKMIHQSESKYEQANRLPLEIIFVDVVAVNFTQKVRIFIIPEKVWVF